MTYYVEPDYWEYGYAVGDPSPGLILGSGVSSSTATPLIAGNYTVASHAERMAALSVVLAGGNLTQVFPGINLNSKSQAFAAGAVISNSNGGKITAQSDVRMKGRPYWELTSPASGTWTQIVPQSEGAGK